ncbi:zinc transport system permease protein [Brassicibacter mesophilus]
MEILSYSFMQRALVIGIIVSLICSTVGLFLVLRRFSMVGDTLSHVALAGVALGMVTNIYPVYTAIFMSVGASLIIERLRREYEKYAELSLAIILAAGIGIASVLISVGRGKTSGIMSYLFGSISLVTIEDLYAVILLGFIIIGSIIFLYRALFYITFDEESAKLSGVSVKKINLYFSVLVALSITISMRIVGILLVSSLMTIPVATSLQVSKSFKQALLYANLFGLVSVIIGLVSSFYLDIAPGGTIVITSLFILLIVITIKNLLVAFDKKSRNNEFRGCKYE